MALSFARGVAACASGHAVVPRRLLIGGQRNVPVPGGAVGVEAGVGERVARDDPGQDAQTIKAHLFLFAGQLSLGTHAFVSLAQVTQLSRVARGLLAGAPRTGIARLLVLASVEGGESASRQQAGARRFAS